MNQGTTWVTSRFATMAIRMELVIHILCRILQYNKRTWNLMSLTKWPRWTSYHKRRQSNSYRLWRGTFLVLRIQSRRKLWQEYHHKLLITMPWLSVKHRVLMSLQRGNRLCKFNLMLELLRILWRLVLTITMGRTLGAYTQKITTVIKTLLSKRWRTYSTDPKSSRTKMKVRNNRLLLHSNNSK